MCPNSTLRSVTPFALLVAALGDDKIVGTDDPDAPLTRDGLAALVSQPELMSAFVGFRFKSRASNKNLDSDTLQKLCSKAICALRISECSQHEPALGGYHSPHCLLVCAGPPACCSSLRCPCDDLVTVNGAWPSYDSCRRSPSRCAVVVLWLVWLLFVLITTRLLLNPTHVCVAVCGDHVTVSAAWHAVAWTCTPKLSFVAQVRSVL